MTAKQKMALETLMNKIAKAAVDAAKDGLPLGEASAATLQLAVKLTERLRGREGTVVMLRRIASEMSGPAPLNVVEMFKRD